MFDPEVPASFQDADIEMAAAHAEGNRIARLHAAGVCTHGSVQGPESGPIHCREEGCEAVFANFDAWCDAREEALGR